MAEKIKLQNTHHSGHHRQTGAAVFTETNETVCSKCRHLVDPNDKFCNYCGDALQDSVKIEHWHGRKKMDDSQYATLKTKTKLADFRAHLDSLPDEPIPNTVTLADLPANKGGPNAANILSRL